MRASLQYSGPPDREGARLQRGSGPIRSGEITTGESRKQIHRRFTGNVEPTKPLTADGGILAIAMIARALSEWQRGHDITGIF